MSSRSKKKEPRYVCLSGAKASHSHKMWTEVSSSVPHLLQMWLLFSPIIHRYIHICIYRCLLKVLCPVSRSETTLDCVLLKDSSRAPVARLGPEINSRACLCVLQGPRHNSRCCFSIQYCLVKCCSVFQRIMMLSSSSVNSKIVADILRDHSAFRSSVNYQSVNME
jgi:hypothetical protein